MNDQHELWIQAVTSGDPEQPQEPGELIRVDKGNPQALVPAGVWQAAEPLGDEPVLVSCIVSPGFDFADFRLAD